MYVVILLFIHCVSAFRPNNPKMANNSQQRAVCNSQQRAVCYSQQRAVCYSQQRSYKSYKNYL